MKKRLYIEMDNCIGCRVVLLHVPNVVGMRSEIETLYTM